MTKVLVSTDSFPVRSESRVVDEGQAVVLRKGIVLVWPFIGSPKGTISVTQRRANQELALRGGDRGLRSNLEGRRGAHRMFNMTKSLIQELFQVLAALR